MMTAEGNKGGDYIQIARVSDDEVFLEVGHCCVIVFSGIIPTAVLTGIIAKSPLGAIGGRPVEQKQKDELVSELPWSEEYNEKLVERIRTQDVTYVDQDRDMQDIGEQALRFLKAGTIKKQLKEQNRLVRLWAKMEKRKAVHNRVTKSQLALKEGDSVEVTLDDGSKTTDTVRGEPCKVSGTWVTWLTSRGCYALCRCKPLKVRPAGAK